MTIKEHRKSKDTHTFQTKKRKHRKVKKKYIQKSNLGQSEPINNTTMQDCFRFSLFQLGTPELFQY
jgi:phage protein D